MIFLFIIVLLGLTFYGYVKDLFLGVYLFYLSLYIVMPIVGYMLFPELSMLMNAYFGPEIIPYIMVFVILSMIWILVVFLTFRKFLEDKFFFTEYLINVCNSNKNYTKLFALFFIVCHFVFLLAYLIFNSNDLSYINLTSDRQSSIFLDAFILCYKFCPGLILVLYDQVRKKVISFWLFMVCLIVFLVITMKLGFKTDMVALFTGFYIYFSYLKNTRTLFLTKRFIFSLILFFIGIAVSTYFRHIGYENPLNSEDGNVFLSIVDKDYFPPGHLLFASYYYKMVDPILVIKSNLFNLFPGVKYHYLQFFVTELFNPGITTRSNSYAYYILTEGYNFMGFMGFLYNGLIIGSFLAWYRFGFKTRCKETNNLIVSIFSLNLVNLTRGQSVYFIKYLFMICLLSIFVHFLFKQKILFLNRINSNDN